MKMSGSKKMNDSNYPTIIQVDEATKSFMEEIQNNLLGRIDEPISEIEAKIKNISEEINTIKQNVATIPGAVSSTVKALNEKVDTISEKTETLLKTATDDQMKKISALSENIESIHKSNNQNADEISQLKQSVEENKQLILSTSETLTSLINSDKKEILDKIDELHIVLSELKKNQNSIKKTLQTSNKKIDSILKHISLRIKLEE